MGRKAGRGQPHVPPSASEFGKCKPELELSYRRDWTRLAAISRPTLFDWDDRAVSRFRSPTLPFKILYLADGKETAFWEVFGAGIADMPVDNRSLSKEAQVETREWVTFQALAGLRIIDVTKASTIHSLRANASTWLAPYSHCQAWSRALMGHPMKLDGVIYQSCRHGGAARCLALFSRPDTSTMERFLLARNDANRISIDHDPEFLRLLIRNDIDMR